MSATDLISFLGKIALSDAVFIVSLLTTSTPTSSISPGFGLFTSSDSLGKGASATIGSFGLGSVMANGFCTSVGRIHLKQIRLNRLSSDQKRSQLSSPKCHGVNPLIIISEPASITLLGPRSACLGHPVQEHDVISVRGKDLRRQELCFVYAFSIRKMANRITQKGPCL